MKKNIIIGILIVCNLVTIGFTIQQSSESKRFKEIAEDLKFQAEENKRNIESSLQITQQYMLKAEKEIKEQKALDEKLPEGKK